MQHIINVSLRPADSSGDAADVRVFADPNPLPEVQPGDTVVWLLDPSTDGRELRVEFDKVRAPAVGGSTSETPTAPTGPCPALERRTAIVGQVLGDRHGLFIYKFLEGDAQVAWGNKMHGTENFGGLEVPQPAPRGG